MPGIENLFAVEPTLPNEHTFKLSDNVQEWPTQIANHARELFPDTQRLSLTIELKKQDPATGTAIGGLHVEEPQTQKKIILPLIIKAYELSPLDVWMEAKTQAVHPLDQETFKKEFFTPSLSEGLDQRPADGVGEYFNDPSTWNSNYPPLQGRYSYASAGYPLLDQISDTLSKTALEEFRTTFKNEPTLLLQFTKHGHKEIIQKIAAKSPAKSLDLAEESLKKIPLAAVSVKKIAPGQYSVLGIKDRAYDLVRNGSYLNEEDAKAVLNKLVPEESLHELHESGEKLIILKPQEEKSVYLYDHEVKPEILNSTTCATVKTLSGLSLEGVYIDRVCKLDGKLTNHPLFLSKTYASVQPKIAGLVKENPDLMKEILAPSRPSTGQSGVFVAKVEGRLVATEVLAIASVNKDAGEVKAHRLDGSAVTLCVDGPVNYLDKEVVMPFAIPYRESRYQIPNAWAWVQFEQFCDLADSENSYLEKEASLHQTLNPMTIRWTGSSFQVSDQDIGSGDMDDQALSLTLVAKGTPLEKVALVLKKAKRDGKVKVHGLSQLRKKAEIIKEASETQARLETLCSKLRTNLIKAASQIDDSATVDTLLSLNFLNPQNLAKFVSYTSVFEKAQDYLAEVLIASRLALKEVNQSAVGTAISQLREVINGLKAIESGMKNQGALQKTAEARYV